MKTWKLALPCLAGLLLPQLAAAQGLPEHIRGLHGILKDLYDEMMPLCEDLIIVGQAIAGFAATFYIGARVWKHIANAEAVDFYPLFRPFVLGFCILIFPQVITLINSVLYPTVAGTRSMVEESYKTIESLLEKREQEMRDSRAYKMYGVNDGAGDRDTWMLYTYPDDIGEEGLFGSIGNDIEFAMSRSYYNLKNWFKELVSFLLQLLYEAAALCINTIRTFNLLIMAILGPMIFGLAVFDGLQHTLTVWLARYINFYLWLPIANILGALLGKIQEGMISLDIEQMNQYGDSFFTSSDVGYLIFMIIGIVSYFTIPSMASLVVNAGGSGGGGALSDKITNMTFSTARMGGMVTTGAAGAAAGMAADSLGDANLMMTKGYGSHGANSGYFSDKLSD